MSQTEAGNIGKGSNNDFLAELVAQKLKKTQTSQGYHKILETKDSPQTFAQITLLIQAECGTQTDPIHENTYITMTHSTPFLRAIFNIRNALMISSIH